jgi:hypothetical protein
MAGEETDPRDDVPARFQVDFTGRTLLGIYRVERRLADGGMGSVYLAEDTNLGMRVVVKVPHARFLGEPGFRTRFRREVSELVRLEHPHVVRILARGEEEEVPYFVLQYLGGGTLEDRIREARETPDASLRWLQPIARTLDFVHDRGVVHRDVKPGNILFDEREHVFLSDFGVVKALGRDDGGEKTEAGTGVGSPIYMAPEQGLGRDVTGAADQYALASTLYEALAGEPPFGHGSVLETMMRKQKGDFPPLRSVVPGLAPASEAAVHRALATEPSDRFPTCSAFVDAFAAGLAPASLGARPRAPRWAVPVAAALLLVALGAGIALGWFRSGREGPDPALDTTREIVMLGSTGSAPRRTLRYRFAPGARDRFVFHSMERVVIPQMPVEKHVREVTMESHVEDVPSGKPARIAWTFHPARLPKDDEVPDEMRAKAQARHDAMGLLRATSRMNPRGSTLEASVRAEGKVSPTEEGFVEALEESVRSIGIVFPQEAIGVGAEWDVTQAARISELRVQQTITYKLLEMDGDRLRLGMHLRQSLSPQVFAPPGAPEGFEMKVRSMTGSGDGEEVVDLTRPAPFAYEVKGGFTMEIESPFGPQQTFHVEGTYLQAVRRE